MTVNDLLALQHVPRWSIVAHSKPQTVADHTYGVMVIALEIAKRMGVELSKTALIYALYHDGPESRSGDIPSGAKAKIEAYHEIDLLFDTGDVLGKLKANMTEAEMAIIRVADKMEGATFITKWGVGRHSERVAKLCWTEAMYVAGQSPQLVQAAAGLMKELVEEAGR